MQRRAFLFLAFLALLGCASAPPPPPAPNIYVMRHLNTPKGATDPDLTAAGLATAAALAQWLSRDPPSVIFVSNTKRAMQTAAPTAQRFGVTPLVYDPADTPGLIAAIGRQHGTILVVGHSNTVPDIVAGLGGERPAPLVHEDFGGIWHIHGPERLTAFSQLP
jgi:broad specificity phosphatase PhoE